MGLIGLWLIAVLGLVASVGLFVAVAVATHPRTETVDRLTRVQQHDEIVRQACADLDTEYRELLSH